MNDQVPRRLHRSRHTNIVVVLEVMWGMPGDKPLRWFHISRFNHSGKRLINLIGHRNFVVTNACPDVVYSASGRGTPSKDWLRANLAALRPELLIVCGKVAQATFEPAMAPQAKVVRLPHPAARTWSKQSILTAKRKLAKLQRV